MKMLCVVCLISALMAGGLVGCSKAEQQPMPEQARIGVTPPLTDRITQAVDEAKKAAQKKVFEAAKVAQDLAKQEKLAEVEAKAGVAADADKV